MKNSKKTTEAVKRYIVLAWDGILGPCGSASIRLQCDDLNSARLSARDYRLAGWANAEVYDARHSRSVEVLK